MSGEIKGFRPGSKSWKKMMAKVYGWGGALVIVGAMFKIQHWPGAAITLIGGLGVEAVIFILSAFEPLHEEYDWSLVYPELAALDDEEEEHELIEEGEAVGAEDDLSVTEQLDKMLEEAKIGPELISSLGDGFRGLADQTSKLTNLADVSVATNQYADSVKKAAGTVDELAAQYTAAADSLRVMSVSEEQGKNYGEALSSISKNLTELNSIYELQLQGSRDHAEATNKLYSGMSELVQNLNDSVEDTRKYKENISELSNNLSQLNNVYGNMLNAMTVR